MSATSRGLEQASLGGQYPLVIHKAPDGVAGLEGLRLTAAGALAAGTYYCVIPMEGLFTGIYLHLKATFASGSCTSSADTTYYWDPPNYNALSASVPARYQAFSGVGAMTTATQQDSSLTTLKGERFAVVKIVIVTGPATFTMGEYNAL